VAATTRPRPIVIIYYKFQRCQIGRISEKWDGFEPSSYTVNDVTLGVGKVKNNKELQYILVLLLEF